MLDTLVEIRDSLITPEPVAIEAPDPATAQRFGLPDASESGLQVAGATSARTTELLQRQVDQLNTAVTELKAQTVTMCALATISQVAARDNKAGLEEVRKPLQEIADIERLKR